MATRNLARTVIEAGRTSRSKYDRKQLRRSDRRNGRNYCRRAVRLADIEEVDFCPPGGAKGYAFAQDDNIGPARRWLASKVGERWDDVFSELSERFRGRGIALSHVVDQHMLGWVNYRGDSRYPRFYDFVVDADGILRENPERFRRNPYPRGAYHKYKQDKAAAALWAGNRRIIIRGERAFWTSPDKVVYFWIGRTQTATLSHRQGRALTVEERKFFDALDPRVRDELRHS